MPSRSSFATTSLAPEYLACSNALSKFGAISLSARFYFTVFGDDRSIVHCRKLLDRLALNVEARYLLAESTLGNMPQSSFSIVSLVANLKCDRRYRLRSARFGALVRRVAPFFKSVIRAKRASRYCRF